MIDLQPQHVFMTSGVGIHGEKTASFEMALRAARIHPYNLVSVSSIMPPNVNIISVDEGIEMIPHGSITFAVLSRNQCKEQDKLISAAVGWALPEDRSTYGYISEVHLDGYTEQETSDWCEDLAAELLASCYGLEYTDKQWERAWDQKTETWTIANRPVKSDSVCKAFHGIREKWVTTIAAAVFVL